MRDSEWLWVVQKFCALVTAFSTSFLAIHTSVFAEYGFGAVVAIFFTTLWLVDIFCKRVIGKNHE